MHQNLTFVHRLKRPLLRSTEREGGKEGRREEQGWPALWTMSALCAE
jgi:hypothetical protein